MKLSQDLQEFLHYPVLQKMDATTGLPENEELYDLVSQSVLVVFLTGLYKSTRTKEAAEEIHKQQNAKELLDKMFQDKAAVLTVVAEYTNKPEDYINTKLEEVAAGYLQMINQSDYVTALQKENSLEEIMSSERHNILACLPPKLKAGKLFSDETIDDNTNKMEGPISSLMNKIGDVFSSGD